MIKNFLKIAFRSLLKNKMFSIINISGLAIGITSFILIMLFVSYELSYDEFYANSKNIYRVYMDYMNGDQYEAGDAQTYNMSGPTLKENFPEIIDFVRFYHLHKTSFEYGNNIHEVLNGHLADKSYFNVFMYPLVQGHVGTALKEPNSIVLTESTSRKIFGEKNPIGENLIAYNGDQNTSLKVTGIIKDIPRNTHLKTNFLISYQTYKNWLVAGQQELNWGNNNNFTYIQLKDDVDISDLKKKISELKTPLLNERHNIEPLTSIHLHSDKPYEAEANGNANSVRYLFAIALFIIILSWLNYISLTTAKSLERAKEVGIRKVSGARKTQLIFQFISESVILNFAALLIAIGLTTLLLPYFNSFVGKEINLYNHQLIYVFAGVFIIGILTSGLYPSILLSSFSAVNVLKGKVLAISGKVSFKKSIVIIQFTATIILLVGTLTTLRQMKYMTGLPNGMSLNQTIAIESTIIDEKQNLENAFQVLKNEVQKLSFVESASLSRTYPGGGYENMSTFCHLTFPNGIKDEKTNWFNYEVDENYISTMKFELLAGYNFSENRETNKDKIIINEVTAKKMGLTNYEEAINNKVNFWGKDWIISGVIKNYHHFGVKNEAKPFIIRYAPNKEVLIVKLKSNNANTISNLRTQIIELENVWKNVFTKTTFQYSFIDDKFASLYNEDRRFSTVFTFFTFLAIFIASLGLFGLAFYKSNQRTKEIGIRKVNGAKVSEILTMLNRDFIKWVAIAFVVACPIAYYAMNKWLENFAYKTTLSWWVFALAGILALGIALLTVSWQSWRAATRNPVEALRYE